jgi:hypothetical protein
MTPKTKRVGLFLMTGLVLAIAAIYALPMQQAMACGGGCDGGGKKSGGSCCGGSLVNVQDNGNIKTGNVKVGNVENNKIGNVKTGDIASGNNLKFLNNNDILSKNFNGNNILNDFLKTGDVIHYYDENDEILNDNIGDVIHYYDENDNIKVPVVSDNTLAAFKLLGCGC